MEADAQSENWRAVIDQIVNLRPTIAERKLDFLLGLVQSGPAAAKSKQRGSDFRGRLGYNRETLRQVLAAQTDRDVLPNHAISVRINSTGTLLLNVRSQIVAPSGVRARLASSWAVERDRLRLVTAWAKIYREGLKDK